MSRGIKRALCALLALGLILGGTALAAGREADYRAALALEEAGDYEAAVAAYDALGDYRDSQQRAAACKEANAASGTERAYQAALALEASGEYESAVRAYKVLGSYKDSRDRAAACEAAKALKAEYDRAVALEERERYRDAGKIYAALGDFLDSAGRLAACAEALEAQPEGFTPERAAEYDRAAEAWYRSDGDAALLCALLLDARGWAGDCLDGGDGAGLRAALFDGGQVGLCCGCGEGRAACFAYDPSVNRAIGRRLRVDGLDEAAMDALLAEDGKPTETRTIPAEALTEALEALLGRQPAAADDAAPETFDKAAVRAVQAALNAAGYDCGQPDGLAGKKTAAAVSAYQRDHGMPETGEITRALLEALGVSE